MFTLSLSESAAYIVHRALTEEIEKIVSDDLPRALKASDHVADQRVQMLRDRLTVASETRLDLGEMLGLTD